MRNLPFVPLLKWGGLYLVVAIVLATAAFMMGLVPQAASDSIGRALGIGLVLVCGAVIAGHRRK